MKRFLYAIYFYFKFKYSIRKKLIFVLRDYLTDRTEIKCSYLKEKMVIKNYSAKWLKGEELIINYLNKVFNEFPIDKIKYKYDRVEISSQRLPDTFKTTLKDNELGKIPLAVTSDGIVRWSVLNDNSLLLGMAAGSGKTTSLLALLERIEKYHLGRDKTFDELIIVDPKAQSDFDNFKQNKKIVILNSQEQAYGALVELEKLADENHNKRTLVCIEEYTQIINSGDKAKSKEIKRIIQKINTFYRSKKIAILLTTQMLQAENNEINIDGFVKIISSPSRAYANMYNIPNIFCNRNNLIHGRYLMIMRGQVSVCRMNGVKNEK